MLNGARLDLANADLTKDVSPCFTDTEPGAYFAGEGYAALGKSSNYSVCQSSKCILVMITGFGPR